MLPRRAPNHGSDRFSANEDVGRRDAGNGGNVVALVQRRFDNPSRCYWPPSQ